MCSSMSIAALRLRLVLVAGAAVSTTALAPAFGGAASGASPAAGGSSNGADLRASGIVRDAFGPLVCTGMPLIV